MDLLGHVSQAAGNQKTACREGVLGIEGRNAQALLLARLPSSLKRSQAASEPASHPPKLHPRSRKLFPSTHTELSAIAAAASQGVSRM